MPKYSFTAKSLKGELKTGTQEAKDKHELARALHQEGYVLISAVAEKDRRKFELSLSFFGRVSLTEKMMFVRNLQVMISSGLSLPRALETLAFQSESKKLKKVLLEIKKEVIKGENFSESLAKHTDVFPELFQNMIKVGEESGTLDKSLEVLARQMEKEHELKSRIKGALMYPVVIIFAMIGIGALMLVMVVPQLAETFEELGIELPITTKLVIGFSAFLTEKWYLLIFIIILSLFLFRMVLKTKTGKKTIDTLFLKLPIVSSLIKKTNSAYTVRTLSSLIAAGVPIVRSLEIVSGILGNIYYKTAILAAADKVKKGEKLSAALMPYQDIYPLIIFQMIRVGEETGETSKVLARMADFFEEEISNTTKNLASIIEPVLMLVIGAVVGFFAVSMIQPMYGMLGAI